MLRFILHYGIHFLLPLVLVVVFYRSKWRYASMVLLGGILLDVDHLFANPIFHPSRCSIGFHPLHTTPAIVLYMVLFLYPRTRIFGLAALIHMLADGTDCLLMDAGY